MPPSFLPDTYLIAPSLNLLRSRKAANRESGIWRLNNWHYHESVLPEVVAQGGVEALLDALPGAVPETRITILELLVRLAPVGDARDRLLAKDAASRVRRDCSVPSGAAVIDGQCGVLAERLAQALAAQP